MGDGAQAFGVGFEAGRARRSGLGSGIRSAGESIVEGMRRKKDKEHDLKKLLMEFEQRDKEQGANLDYQTKQADRNWELALREDLRKEHMTEVQIDRIVENTRAQMVATDQSQELHPIAMDQAKANVADTEAGTAGRLGIADRAQNAYDEGTGARRAGNAAAIATYRQQMTEAGFGADQVEFLHRSWRQSSPAAKTQMAERANKKGDNPELPRSTWMVKMRTGDDAPFNTEAEASAAYDKYVLGIGRPETTTGLPPLDKGETLVHDPDWQDTPTTKPKLNVPMTAEEYIHKKFEYGKTHEGEGLAKINVPVMAAHYKISESELRQMMEDKTGGKTPQGKKPKPKSKPKQEKPKKQTETVDRKPVVKAKVDMTLNAPEGQTRKAPEKAAAKSEPNEGGSQTIEQYIAARKELKLLNNINVSAIAIQYKTTEEYVKQLIKEAKGS